VQKCPLCDKKIPRGAKFCPHCGWDLTAYELAPAQIARIQEEIVNAKFGYVRWQIAASEFGAVALVFIVLRLLALREVIVIHESWIISGIAAAFLFLAVPCSFLALRHHNKQNRLKMMLNDRRPYQ
jgi:hypothetical protein